MRARCLSTAIWPSLSSCSVHAGGRRASEPLCGEGLLRTVACCRPGSPHRQAFPRPTSGRLRIAGFRAQGWGPFQNCFLDSRQQASRFQLFLAMLPHALVRCYPCCISEGIIMTAAKQHLNWLSTSPLAESSSTYGFTCTIDRGVCILCNKPSRYQAKGV